MEQQPSSQVNAADYIKAVHGVRYQVKNVARAVTFYTQRLGFTLKHQQLPAFANVSLGDADVLLSGPGASGSRPMPNGEQQTPGGWNRVVLRVADLPTCITTLKNAEVTFRNEMEVGPGGRQKIRTGIHSSYSNRHLAPRLGSITSVFLAPESAPNGVAVVGAFGVRGFDRENHPMLQVIENTGQIAWLGGRNSSLVATSAREWRCTREPGRPADERA